MAGETVKCGSCGMDNACDLSFCEQCGTELALAAIPVSTAPGNHLATGEMQGIDVISSGHDVSVHTDSSRLGNHPLPTIDSTRKPCTSPADGTRREGLDIAPPEPDGKVAKQRVRSRCEDLDVYYNNARVFVEGLVMPFEFRLLPRRKGIEDLFLEIRINQQVVARTELQEELEAGYEIPVAIPFTPSRELLGKVPFEILLGYHVEDHPHCFIFRKLHTCYGRTEPMGEVIRNLKIELHGNSSATGAADSAVTNRIEGLDTLLTRRDGPAEDFRHVDIPAIWDCCRLARMRVSRMPDMRKQTALPVQPPSAHLDRLSIERASDLVHVLACRHAAVGRNRDVSQVVPRIPWSGPAKHPANPNLMVSGLHVTLELREGNWFARDGGKRAGSDWKASLHGTYLDGERLGCDGQPSLLQADVPFLLAMGQSDDGKAILSMHGRVWSHAALREKYPVCRECIAGTPPAPVLVLQFMQESYVLLPEGGFAMNLLDPAWYDMGICRCKGGFLLRAGSTCAWLEPGFQKRIGNDRLEVHTYMPARKGRKDVSRATGITG